MSLALKIADSKAGQVLALGLLAGVAVWWLSRRAGQVASALNPADRGNLAYTGVNALGQSITGDDYWSLGGWFFDATHPDYDVIAEDIRTGRVFPHNNTPASGAAPSPDFLRTWYADLRYALGFPPAGTP